jgi:hypothetical protein
MTFNKREKILAILAGVGGVLVLLWFLLFFGDSRSRDVLRAERDKLDAEVKKKEATINASRAIETKVEDWKRRALPPGDNAGSLYHSWLSGLADGIPIRELKIDTVKGRKAVGGTPYVSTLTGRVSLKGLTAFLYKFYTAGHLHFIHTMDVKPSEKDPTDLNVKMEIRSLSLPEATRPKELTKEPGKQLKSPKLDDYAVIDKRNLFLPPIPPKPKPPATDDPPPFDSAAFTMVTAILEEDGVPQVSLWERTRTSNPVILAEGDTFRVGRSKGKIKEVGDRDVLIEIDGVSKRILLGCNLHGDERPGGDGKGGAPGSKGSKGSKGGPGGKSSGGKGGGGKPPRSKE